MEIRTALLQLRSELHMRQTDLAGELGVSSITLCRWENGNNKPGRAMSLAILSIASSHGASTVCRAALKEALMPSPAEPGIDDLRFARLDQINRLVNDSSNAVIVSDAENHDILYVNQQMGVVTGKPVALASKQKCYEYLFGKDQPCEFCKVGCFSETAFTTGEYTSERTGRYYVTRGKLITWNDRRAHIEYISDMTEFHLTQAELTHHRELLSLACKNAQIWVFSLDVQTGVVYPDRVVRKALRLPGGDGVQLDAILRADSSLARSSEALAQALAGLKRGKATAEVTAQTKLNSSRAHWVRFRAKLVEKDKNGAPKMAVCSAQIIDEELALQNRIRFEHAQIIDSRKDLVGYVISDITRNTILESRGQVLDSDFPRIGAPFDASVRYAATKIEPLEDREAFLQMHDRAFLLSQFTAGRFEQSSEYQTLQPDGKLLWIRNRMKLVPKPESDDILLYEYSFSQHTQRVMSGLLAASMQSGFEALGAVSLLKNQVARLRFSPDGTIDEEALVFASYTDETRAYCERCVVPAERQAFFQAVAPERLKRELLHKTLYRVAYKELGPDGLPHSRIAQYTLYDSKRQFCLLSVLDPDKLTASVKNVDVIHTEETA